MIKIILSLLLLTSCSTLVKEDCPMRKKGIACHQKAVGSVLKEGASKKDAALAFKNCCEKYKYKKSCKEFSMFKKRQKHNEF